MQCGEFHECVQLFLDGELPALPKDFEAHRAACRDYDVAHYLQLFRTTYVGRLRKAFTPEDFNRLFRSSAQIGLFDQPIQTIEPLWIGCGKG